jgi:hypothetical protein
MKRFIFLWVCIPGIVILIGTVFISLFIPLYNYLPIFNRVDNSSYFVSSIYTIITGLTFLLIFFSFRESQKQTFDATFFKYLESHRSIIDRLQQGKLVVLNESFEEETVKTANNKKDFFDVLYNILDKTYNENQSKSTVKERIDEFFKGYYYLIGHYVRNFFSLMKYVDRSNLLNNKQKRFYIEVLRDMSTIDDLRFLIYAIIWKSKDNEGNEWAKLFDKYKILDFIGNNENDKQLILTKDDFKAWKLILTEKKKKGSR